MQVRAYIKFSEDRLGPIGIAVVLLAGLLTGFFWLGYWVSATNLANAPQPAPQAPQVFQLPVPNPQRVPENVPTPTQLLKREPEETVHL